MTAVRPRPGLALFTALLLAGCGSDGGSSNHKLDDAISLDGAPYVVVDTGTGRAYGLSSVSDPASYTGREMLFKRIEAGSLAYREVSAAGDTFRQGDEAAAGAGGANHGTFYLAVLECTQTQWQAMAGSRPWQGLSAALSRQAGNAAAHNLSLDAIDGAIGALNRDLAGSRVRLPTGREWEAAARLDADGTDYTFGDNGTDPIATGLVAPHAWTFETVSGAVGPFTAGAKARSPGGFHDLHGNVWEPVAGGGVRGGSWRDVVLQARIANTNESLDPSVPHPLVGLRLALDLK